MNPSASFLRAALLATAATVSFACTPWAAAQTAPAAKPAPKPPAKAQAKPPARPGAIKTPASPQDLMHNLKVVLDGHQLLSDKFYEDDNLLKVFGASQARWFKLPRPFIKNGKLTGVAHVFQLPAGTTPPAIDVLYKYVIQGNQEKRRALIGLDLPRDARATIDMAQTVFGKNLKVTNPAYNDDPSRVRAPTPGEHPLGNRLVTYEFDAPASSATLSFMVNGDGTLANLMMVEEEKAWKMAPVVVGPGAKP